MNTDNLTQGVPTAVQPYYTAYAQTLTPAYEANQAVIDQNRRNQFQQIMGKANQAGMLHSNLTARDKIKYDTATYMPATEKNFTSYRTGIDKLYENSASLQNQIRSLQEKIADLNEA